MYAVIETGGKQYHVELGTELAVELLDFPPGAQIDLDRVLLVADGDQASIGRPLVPDARVMAEVLRADRGEKLISFKYRPKARRRVTKGHRQELTVLRITDVRLGTRSAAEDQRRAQEAATAEQQRIAEAAARQAAEDVAIAARLAAERSKAVAEREARLPARGRGSRRTGGEDVLASDRDGALPRNAEPVAQDAAMGTPIAGEVADAPDVGAVEEPEMSAGAAALPQGGAGSSEPSDRARTVAPESTEAGGSDEGDGTVKRPPKGRRSRKED